MQIFSVDFLLKAQEKYNSVSKFLLKRTIDMQEERYFNLPLQNDRRRGQ